MPGLLGRQTKLPFSRISWMLDVLAIAPYWISLFFLDESSSVEAVNDESSLLEDDGEANSEEDSTFGSVSRIMQVHEPVPNSKPWYKFLGFSNCSNHENFQTRQKICGVAINGPHVPHKLEGYWPLIFFGKRNIHHFLIPHITLQSLTLIQVLMGMLLFGSLGYYLENGEEDTGFSSIPQGMWWAVQTLTSVGYGDFTTETLLGKVLYYRM